VITAREFRAGGGIGQAGNERTIDLEDIDWKAVQVRKRGVARAEIDDRLRGSAGR